MSVTLQKVENEPNIFSFQVSGRSFHSVVVQSVKSIEFPLTILFDFYGFCDVGYQNKLHGIFDALKT